MPDGSDKMPGERELYGDYMGFDGSIHAYGAHDDGPQYKYKTDADERLVADDSILGHWGDETPETR
jgi:hypothetical protein